MPDRRTFLTAMGALVFMTSELGAETNVMTASDAMKGVEDGSLILLDVRRPEEWMQTGVAKGAWLLDMTDQEFGPRLMAVLQRNPEHKVAIICRTGNRTGYLSDVLAQNGITGVLDVSEGMVGGPNGQGWIPSGLPVVSAEDAYSAMPKDLQVN